MSQHVSRETECIKQNIQQQIALKRAGRRKYVRHGGTLCGHCLVNPPAGAGQRYCRECRNAASLACYHRKQQELKRLRAAHGGDHG